MMTDQTSFSRLLDAANELLANLIDRGLHKPDLGIDGNEEDFPVGEDGDRWYADAWELQQADEAARKDQKLYDAAPAMLNALKGVAIMLRTALKDYQSEPWAQAVFAAIAKAEGRSPVQATRQP